MTAPSGAGRAVQREQMLMSNSENRWLQHRPKVEILGIIQDVTAVMADRRKKVSVSADIDHYRLEISFLEQQVAKAEADLAELNDTIRQREEVAKEPTDVLLNLRAAKKTFVHEYDRFLAIEQKSRLIVQGRNREQIEQLAEENALFEQRRATIRNGKQAAEIRQGNLAARQQQLREEYKVLAYYFENIAARIHEELVAQEDTANALENEQKELNSQLQGLMAQEKEAVAGHEKLAEELAEQKHLAGEYQQALEHLEKVKARVDKLDDPGEYINSLTVRLEKERLGARAKTDVLATINNVIAEVTAINRSLEKEISDYRAITSELEVSLNAPEED